MKHSVASDSAFPSFAEINGHEVIGWDGMTMREWYAGLAMQGLLANPEALKSFDDGARGDRDIVLAVVAACAFAHADAMLAEAKKGGGR